MVPRIDLRNCPRTCPRFSIPTATVSAPPHLHLLPGILTNLVCSPRSSQGSLSSSYASGFPGLQDKGQVSEAPRLPPSLCSRTGLVLIPQMLVPGSCSSVAPAHSVLCPDRLTCPPTPAQVPPPPPCRSPGSPGPGRTSPLAHQAHCPITVMVSRLSGLLALEGSSPTILVSPNGDRRAPGITIGYSQMKKYWYQALYMRCPILR